MVTSHCCSIFIKTYTHIDKNIFHFYWKFWLYCWFSNTEKFYSLSLCVCVYACECTCVHVSSDKSLQEGNLSAKKTFALLLLFPSIFKSVSNCAYVWASSGMGESQRMCGSQGTTLPTEPCPQPLFPNI